MNTFGCSVYSKNMKLKNVIFLSDFSPHNIHSLKTQAENHFNGLVVTTDILSLVPI